MCEKESPYGDLVIRFTEKTDKGKSYEDMRNLIQCLNATAKNHDWEIRAYGPIVKMTEELNKVKELSDKLIERFCNEE